MLPRREQARANGSRGRTALKWRWLGFYVTLVVLVWFVCLAYMYSLGFSEHVLSVMCAILWIVSVIRILNFYPGMCLVLRQVLLSYSGLPGTCTRGTNQS